MDLERKGSASISVWKSFPATNEFLPFSDSPPLSGIAQTEHTCAFWHVDWGGWKQGWFTCRETSDEPWLLPWLTKRLPYWGSGGCRNCCLSLIGGLFLSFFFSSRFFVKRFLLLGLEISELLECLPAAVNLRSQRRTGNIRSQCHMQ